MYEDILYRFKVAVLTENSSISYGPQTAQISKYRHVYCGYSNYFPYCNFLVCRFDHNSCILLLYWNKQILPLSDMIFKNNVFTKLQCDHHLDEFVLSLGVIVEYFELTFKSK